MPIFQFNRSENSLNLFGSSNGLIPRVGLNFGDSKIARTLGSFLSFSGRKRKGHPGSGGQVVGQGVRNLRNLFQGRLLGGDSIDAISSKKWKYEQYDIKGGFPKFHPPGFTPLYAFYQKAGGLFPKTWRPFKKYGVRLKIPVEKGWQPMAFANEKFNKNYIQTIDNTLNRRIDILDKRDRSTKNFSFYLDRNTSVLQINPNFSEASDSGNILYNGLQTGKDISLISWMSTSSDNEDPTILGFDIEIDEVTSPLFNGSILQFLSNFGYQNDAAGSPPIPDIISGPITELESRGEIYVKFRDQFKTFFKTNIQNTDQNGTPKSVKNHYITQISGLDKLGHLKSTTSADSGSNIFTNFPSEKITLTLNEDVSQNISYLSYLYNLLSRSRIEGRRIIPQNLLRFNCKITVTEIRNYNRVVKILDSVPGRSRRNRLQRGSDFGEKAREEDNTKYLVLSDLISKKEYNLYECEFFFDKLTHGSSINLQGTGQNTTLSVTVDFNYKFVSSEFHRFEFDDTKPISTKPEDRFSYTKYNDEFFNPRQLTSLDTGRALISQVQVQREEIGITNSAISFLDPELKIYKFDAYPKDGYPLSDSDASPLGRQKLGNLARNFVGGLVRNLVTPVLRVGAEAINEEINSRFNLVNKAINKRLEKAGLSVSLNTINDPRNIYNPGNRLRNELRNAIRGFVGRSTRRFFSQPLNTSEANNGFLPQRSGGPFRSSTIYRPVATRRISRIRASQIRPPRNIYVRRRIAAFLANQSLGALDSSRSTPGSIGSARINPFIQNLTSSSLAPQGRSSN